MAEDLLQYVPSVLVINETVTSNHRERSIRQTCFLRSRVYHVVESELLLVWISRSRMTNETVTSIKRERSVR